MLNRIFTKVLTKTKLFLLFPMNYTFTYRFFLTFFLFSVTVFSQVNQPPGISVSGRDAYCPLSQVNIASNFTISDPDNIGIPNFYIQISSGYDQFNDVLILNGNHPTIITTWNVSEGKLTFSSSNSFQILYTDLQLAVRDVVFQSTNPSVVGEKFFSFTIDTKSFLPSTGHFYEFVPELRISWFDARQRAEDSNYFGLQGYLATITRQDEAQLIGEQATGTGWIGGSDAVTEGLWFWVTGPEAGTLFWQGGINGFSPNFAFWNQGEPNDLGDEDYAHITDPSIGIIGSWNDLDAAGGNGLYEAKGYIVEYGGMPGDPDISISGSTSIFIPEVDEVFGASVCDTGSVTLRATSTLGDIVWFDAAVGGNIIANGTTFTTPVLSTTTNYFAAVSVNGCLVTPRTLVQAIVNQTPTVTNFNETQTCQGTTAIISAEASAGNILWYDSITSTIPIFIGNVFTTPSLFNTTTYFVEAALGNCVSAIRTPVIVTVDTEEPSFDIPAEVILCRNIGSIDVEPTNTNANYAYTWFNEFDEIVGTNSLITIKQEGTYSVTATAVSGCESATKFFKVSASEISNFNASHIKIDDVTNSNSVLFLIDNLGIGEYEFSLDNANGPFSQQTFFENLSPGIHTLYIRDKLGCGIQTYQFFTLNYPKFFTPNDDGINDLWNLVGTDASFYQSIEIQIFNRFGVLVATLDKFSIGWNGFYSGNRMPTSDYWFLATLIDNNNLKIVRSGHFSLLRPN